MKRNVLRILSFFVVLLISYLLYLYGSGILGNGLLILILFRLDDIYECINKKKL